MRRYIMHGHRSMKWAQREKQIHRGRCVTVHLHINISVMSRNLEILLSSAFGMELSPIVIGALSFCQVELTPSTQNPFGPCFALRA